MAAGAQTGGGVALLAAFGPELAPLATRTRLFGPSMSSTFTVPADALRGAVGGIAVTGRAVGIGLAAAAVGTARALEELRPRAVAMVGTCGAYDGASLMIGDVVVSRRVGLADTAALAGQADFPAPMGTSLEGDPSLVDGLVRAGARAVDVATTLAISVDDALAARIAQGTGASVEHLEAYGAGVACAAFGVPFVAVLGVANRVGLHARAEWREHHGRASEACIGVVIAWLEALSSLEGR